VVAVQLRPTAGDGSPNEAQRLAAAAAGDDDAVRWLLDEVAPVVHGFLYARLGGDAAAVDDLLQETVIEAVRGAGGFRGDAQLSTWMCAIARRRVARHFERERRDEVRRANLRVVPEAGLDESLERAEQRDEVVRALGRLPVLHRQVLVLKYLDEMGVEEIAGELGRTRVQVQSLLQRARDGLRRELGESDD
jgi:RNA polymerase sigma-70 factor (ECF subfamily)